MKRIILSLVLLISYFATNAQKHTEYTGHMEVTPWLSVKDMESGVVDSIISIFSNEKYRALTYLKNTEKGPSSVILIVDIKEEVRYWIFDKDLVIIEEGLLVDNSIFNYEFYLKTKIVKSEYYAFSAPVLGSDNAEYVYYRDNKKSLFFGYGNPRYYIENPKLVKYRQEWIEIIRKELGNLLQ